jgi:alpha-1,6-mannosyltransferase
VGRAAGARVIAGLGVLSAALYAAVPPLSAWLGLEPLQLHLPAFGAAFLLYLLALRLVWSGRARGHATLAVVLGFGLVFRLLVLWTPVYLSDDAYRYLWDGRVQWTGVNPYRYAPAAPELQWLRDPAVHLHINRPNAVTVYPPAAEWLFAFAAKATSGTLPGWRLLLLGVDALTVGLLLRLLRRLGAPAEAVLAYAWSPLVVFEGIQSGHVDLALVPLVLVALGWRMAGSSWRAGVALGGAVLMKLYPAILVLAWWRRGDWRWPAAVAATVALGYLPYAATVGWGALGFLPTYLGDPYEDANIGLRALVTYPFGFTNPLVRGTAMALFFALSTMALVHIARTRRPGAVGLWRATALAVGAYLLLVPTAMHPWYVLWLVPFLCVRPSRAALFFTGGVTLSYIHYLVDPRSLPMWAWLAEYGTLYALLLWEWRAGRLGLGAPSPGGEVPTHPSVNGPSPAGLVPAGPPRAGLAPADLPTVVRGQAGLDAGSPGSAGATVP